MNKKYVGIYEFNKTRKRDKHGKRNYHAKKETAEIITVKGKIPPLIDEDTFYAVNDKIERRLGKNMSGRKAKNEVYLLTGLLKCGKCGYSMAGHLATQTGKYYYECIGRKNHKEICDSPQVLRDEIEGAVINYVERLISPTTKTDILNYFNNTDVKVKHKEKALDYAAQIKKLKADGDAIIDKILHGLDSELMRVRLTDIEKQIANLEAELKKTEKINKGLDEITNDTLTSFFDSVQNIRQMSREEQRDCIRKVIDNIVLFYDREQNPPKRRMTITSKLSSFSSSIYTDFAGAEDPSRTISVCVPFFIQDTVII
jgi:site-specific DNA recombinase